MQRADLTSAALLQTTYMYINYLKGSVVVQGLEEVMVHDKTEVYDILKKGSQKRQTAATQLNAHSR